MIVLIIKKILQSKMKLTSGRNKIKDFYFSLYKHL